MTPDYLTLSPEQAAIAHSEWVARYDKEEPVRWAELGLRCNDVEKRQLWSRIIDPSDGLPFGTFNRWLIRMAPRAPSTCRQAMADVKALSDVPIESVAALPYSSFDTMKSLSTAVRNDPDVLEAAKIDAKALVACVQRMHPGQHVESKTWWKAYLSTETRQKLEALLDRVGEGSQDERLDYVLEAAICGWDVNSGEARQGQVTVH